jgi:hypothetical protein
MKLARLSAARTDRLYSPEYTPGTYLCQRLSWPQGHTVVVKIKSLKFRMSPSGIKLAKFCLAAQWFNQLRLGVYPNPFTPILISYSYIRFGLLGRNFPSVFLTKILYAFFLQLGCNLGRMSHLSWFHHHKNNLWVSKPWISSLCNCFSQAQDFVSTLFWKSSAYVLLWIFLIIYRQNFLFCLS